MIGTTKNPNNKGFDLFITTAPIPDLNDKIVVFGRVIKGEDIVQVFYPNSLSVLCIRIFHKYSNTIFLFNSAFVLSFHVFTFCHTYKTSEPYIHYGSRVCQTSKYPFMPLGEIPSYRGFNFLH